MNKKTLLHAGMMIFLSGVFIFFVQLKQRPDIWKISNILLSLPGYERAVLQETAQGAYTELEDLDIKDFCIYKNDDSTAREFAVCRVKDEKSADAVITVFQKRAAELEERFSQNEPELHRISYFRIISTEKFVTFTVYDSENTAENLLHDYFRSN